MFKKQPLSDAIHHSLSTGIQLVNEQANVIIELLELISTQVDISDQKIKEFQANYEEFKIDEEDEKREAYDKLSLHVKLKVSLEGTRDIWIKAVTELLLESKEKLLTIQNLDQAKHFVHIPKIFSEGVFSSFSMYKKGIPPAFFSGHSYQQMKQAEENFAAAQLSEDNLISFRQHITAAVAITIYLVTLISFLIATFALLVFTPLALLPLAVLIPISCIFDGLVLSLALTKGMDLLESQTDKWTKHFTSTNDPIDLSDPSLFAKLNELVNPSVNRSNEESPVFPDVRVPDDAAAVDRLTP